MGITLNAKLKGADLEALTGERGAKIINDLEPHDIKASLVILSYDAIVVALKIGGTKKNVVEEYVTSPKLAVGEAWILSGENGQLITHIHLSAGTANYSI